MALFADALQMVLGTLTMFIEGAIVRASLTKAHQLDLSDKEFYLVVRDRQRLGKLLVGLVVVHAHHRDKSHIVQRLSTSGIIAVRSCVGSLSINLCRINIPIMTGIRKRIQLVHRCLVGR